RPGRPDRRPADGAGRRGPTAPPGSPARAAVGSRPRDRGRDLRGRRGGGSRRGGFLAFRLSGPPGPGAVSLGGAGGAAGTPPPALGGRAPPSPPPLGPM